MTRQRIFFVGREQFVAEDLEGYVRNVEPRTVASGTRAKSLPSVLVVQIKWSYNGASFEGATSASISVKCHVRCSCQPVSTRPV